MTRKFGNYHAQKVAAYSLLIESARRDREEAIQRNYYWTANQLKEKLNRLVALRNHHYIYAKGLN